MLHQWVHCSHDEAHRSALFPSSASWVSSPFSVALGEVAASNVGIANLGKLDSKHSAQLHVERTSKDMKRHESTSSPKTETGLQPIYTARWFAANSSWQGVSVRRMTWNLGSLDLFSKWYPLSSIVTCSNWLKQFGLAVSFCKGIPGQK